MRRTFFTGGSLPVISQPTSRLPKCGACGMFKTCKSPKMAPTGTGRRRILIIDEEPGREEDNTGRFMSGRDGRTVEAVLHRHGVNLRTDCWVTGALICKPKEGGPKVKEAIDYCRPNLINTIEKLKPEVIIPLGTKAVESLIRYVWNDGKEVGSILRWAGYRIPCQKLNAWICPTFHPGFLDPKIPVPKLMFERHMRAACRLKGRPWDAVPDYEKEVEVLYDQDEVAARLDAITSGVIAFDYESNMLKPDTAAAALHTCSVCHNGKETFAFPIQGEVVRAALRRLLRNPGVKKIASNAKFEDRWTFRLLGVRVRGWIWDTMLAAHNLENASKTRKVSSVKFQAFVHLGVGVYDAHVAPFLKSKAKGANVSNNIKGANLKQLLVYNGMDSLLEYKVAEVQIKATGGSL